jgi:hypothetical protein
LVDTYDGARGHGESVASSGNVRARPGSVRDSAKFADLNGSNRTALGVRCGFPGFRIADVLFAIDGGSVSCHVFIL